MEKIKKFICKVFGCKMRKAAYTDPHYDVYICLRCGRVTKLIRTK